ncbi:antiviral reverse transcriptase Drt4 [Janthinobacterium sp. J1-1]|uniref:antiviral reverse transcriptase Drt4 n=1 Tax=Janthinobacterium sp. J1-1 TaxID=3065910 RepID=UPI00281256C4|nr:antiviral reverse transcriptase Drt4 [Janthinobacterium sp. J1-1]
MINRDLRHTYEALTRHNYFPNQKIIQELPPCFSTRGFTPEIAEILSARSIPKDRSGGYDHVEYHATRHNNVPRTLGIIHPAAYAPLAKIIFENWGRISEIERNEKSMIKPSIYLDGRMFVMNYDAPEDRVIKTLRESFGCNYRVNTDISGCFGSIYSHSISWAILGIDAAKERVGKPDFGNHWSEKLDFYIRRSKRNETLGIAIGPATSSIVVELILGEIDKKLLDDGYKFHRYIDDYVCFCKNEDDSKNFIQVLGGELRKYKLNLSLAKTSIVALPAPANDGWVSKLVSALPNRFKDEGGMKDMYLHELMQFLDFAIVLNKHTSDGAVLRYAIGLIFPCINDQTLPSMLEYIINLCWHFPTIFPYLYFMMEKSDIDPLLYQDRINDLIIENAKNKRSDGMAWPLYLIWKHKLKITDEAVSKVVESEDCIALCVLHFIGSANDAVVDFAKMILKKGNFEKDKYWILLYQLFRRNLIKSPYQDDTFSILLKNGVNFMPEEGKFSLAEKYCGYVSNPFLDQEDLLSYKDWLVMKKNK